MDGYFVNIELRRSSITLLCLMTLFLVMMLLILQNYHQQLKTDYINTFGTIALKVVDTDPGLKDEVISLITKETSKDHIKKAQDLLQQYGLTTELEDSLFPYLNATFQKNTLTVVLVFILMIVIFSALNYGQYAFFYQRIRRITTGAKRIIEGDYDIAIHENEEGDFSKLAIAFNSMGKIIFGHLNELKKEKQFLVDLMSDISHQLKTPLSSLILYNDIMLQKDLEPEQRAVFLLKKQDQLQRMKWLIHSILKLARLDANSIEFEKEEQSLNETIYNAIDAIESKASVNQVKIHFQEEKEVFFSHDRLWLEEALINILKNGVEHTPPGGQITIHVMKNPLYHRIIIEDTGEGIPEEELPKIFKRFYKVQTSRKSESLGIGLALSRSIIEAHGGIIEVQSQVGVGTRFVLTFLE